MHARNRIAPTWLVAGLAIAAAVSGGGARAQGIPMGKSRFFPSLTVQMGSNSNIFNGPDIPGTAFSQVQDRYATVRAPLVWVLPFRQSSWEFNYTPGTNHYQDTSELDGYTHRVETELELNFSNGARFTLSGAFRDDYLNTEFSGGELAFNAIPYQRIRGFIEFVQPFRGRHGLRLAADLDTLSFDESDAGFSDYDFRSYSAGYLHLLSETLTLLFEGTYSDNFQERPQQGRVTPDDAEDVIWTREGFYFKLEKAFNERDAARFSVGYERLDFKESDDRQFSGFLGQVLYRRRPSNAFDFQAELGRRVNPSAFDVNNFFLQNFISVGGEYRPVTKIFFPFLVSYQENSYPDETEFFLPLGTKRRDRIFSGQAGIGFQFSRIVSMSLMYEYLGRQSNMPQFEYDTRVISLGFRFGWAPNKEYI